MTATWPLLSLVTFLPLVGAGVHPAASAASRDVVARNARNVALWTSLIDLRAVARCCGSNFDRSTAALPVRRERAHGCAAFGITYHMGVDGISMLFVLLSTLLTPLCILASWDGDQDAGCRST